MKAFIKILLSTIVLTACGPSEQQPVLDMDEVAREYLFIELSMGLHDVHHVDAYYGPEEIQQQAVAAALSVEAIEARAQTLSERLGQLQGKELERANPTRVSGLIARLRSLLTRIAIYRQDYLPFDEESLRLFGVKAPDREIEEFDAVLAEIDALLPGEGTLQERVNRFRRRFDAPVDKVPALLEAAIAECRRRTVAHIDLPQNENFRLEYVSNRPWGAYNWYQGGGHSLIQVDTSLPTQISRAVGLACHEGYPGHHAYNVLLEHHLVERRGWIEFSVYPLYSPQSLLAEGTADFGTELVFPGDERTAFERDVLFAIAGLDSAGADLYYQVQTVMRGLEGAGKEAARRYIDGDLDANQTAQWLVDHAMYTRERADQHVRFVDRYRSYVINYNLGRHLVRGWVERRAGSDDESARWSAFVELLTTPRVPSDLVSTDRG